MHDLMKVKKFAMWKNNNKCKTDIHKEREEGIIGEVNFTFFIYKNREKRNLYRCRKTEFDGWKMSASHLYSSLNLVEDDCLQLGFSRVGGGFILGKKHRANRTAFSEIKWEIKYCHWPALNAHEYVIISFKSRVSRAIWFFCLILCCLYEGTDTFDYWIQPYSWLLSW